MQPRMPQALRDYAKAKRLSTLPSPLEFFGYLFACGNLLCGPFYEYSDYSNYVARRASYTTPLSAPWLPGLARLAKSLFFMALYTRCSAEYAPQLLETARFFDLGIMQRYDGLLQCSRNALQSLMIRHIQHNQLPHCHMLSHA